MIQALTRVVEITTPIAAATTTTVVREHLTLITADGPHQQLKAAVVKKKTTDVAKTAHLEISIRTGLNLSGREDLAPAVEVLRGMAASLRLETKITRTRDIVTAIITITVIVIEIEIERTLRRREMMTETDGTAVEIMIVRETTVRVDLIVTAIAIGREMNVDGVSHHPVVKARGRRMNLNAKRALLPIKRRLESHLLKTVMAASKTLPRLTLRPVTRGVARARVLHQESLTVLPSLVTTVIAAMMEIRATTLPTRKARRMSEVEARTTVQTAAMAQLRNLNCR